MAKLKDHRGNPVDTSKLKGEVATQTIAGVRTVWYDSVVTSLTPERLAEIFVAVKQNNDILEYLTLAEEMEELDLHYHSVLSTRRLAVSGLQPIVESVSDDAQRTKEADFVREVFTDEDLIRDLLADQTDAFVKCYSVDEIAWDKSDRLWVPEKYEWRDQRFFQFDRDTGKELRLRDEVDPIDGLPLTPYKFIAHTPRIKSGLVIRGGLALLAAVAYMCKSYGVKDWLAFAEVFGMPLRLGKYGTGASAADKQVLLRAVANIGTDAAAIIPDSMEIEFQDGACAGGGVGEAMFERLANWFDRQVSKGVLGQTMTTDDGSSRSQADVHNEVRSDIKVNDAMQLAATLRRDLVKPLIDLNFGPRDRNNYPRVRFDLEEPEDLEKLAKSLIPFIKVGLPVQASAILDKYGLEEPEEGALLLGGVKPQKQIEEEEKEAAEKPPEPEPTEEPPEGEPEETPPEEPPARTSVTSTEGVYELHLSKLEFRSAESAAAWLLERGYKAVKTGETEAERVYQQRQRSEFTDGPMWAVQHSKGVLARVGRLRMQSLREVWQELHAALMRKVVAGETLSEDQRQLLATLREEDTDAIDALVDAELAEWRKVINPMLQPIIALAQSSETAEEFAKGLETIAKDMDNAELVRSVATASLVARGLGDATDKVKV